MQVAMSLELLCRDFHPERRAFAGCAFMDVELATMVILNDALGKAQA